MKRFLEPALAIGLALSLIFGAHTDNMQKDLSERILRLHVIANSDSLMDQEEKLHVRDLVLARAQELLNDAKSIDEVKTLVSRNLTQLTEAGQKGTARPVRAELTTMYFPTRNYDTFSLPAGEYEAFRIIIGDGKGHNWWCVMFPPLCINASEAITAAESAGLSDEEINLISKGENVYRYRFKLLEILSKIRSSLL